MRCFFFFFGVLKHLITLFGGSNHLKNASLLPFLPTDILLPTLFFFFFLKPTAHVHVDAKADLSLNDTKLHLEIPMWTRGQQDHCCTKQS